MMNFMPARTDLSKDVLQIQIALLNTEPKIWRRLLVPPQFTLSRLHRAIQIAMGWEDDHLHEFRVGKQMYGQPDEDHDPFGITRRKDERYVLVSELFLRVGSKALYTYDFGDSWEHQIVLEKRLKPDPDVIYPVCVAGEMACPPEDIGGIYGYYELVEAIRDPEHMRHGEMLEWVGEDWDPQRFSLEKINHALRKLGRRSRQ